MQITRNQNLGLPKEKKERHNKKLKERKIPKKETPAPTPRPQPWPRILLTPHFDSILFCEKYEINF